MMWRFSFNEEKNLLLKETRGIGFDNIIEAIAQGKIIDDLEHKNPQKHPHQRILVVRIKNYIYAVPYLLDQQKKIIFLKTVFPSRVLTKIYLKKYDRKKGE